MRLVEEGVPLRMMSWLVDRPKCCLSSAIMALVVVSVFYVYGGYFQTNDLTNRDFLVWENQMIVDWDMQVAGKQAVIMGQSY